MRKFRQTLLGSAVVLAAALVAPFSVGAASPDVRILLYHRVGDARYPSTNISSEAFLEQMRWLRQEGFGVVSTRAVEDFLLGNGELPPRAVAIHFDDGYRSVFENAFPVLREFGYPFTVFLPTEALDRHYTDYITWEMAQQMAPMGCTFGAHGHRHERLSPRGEERHSGALELDESRARLQAHGLEARWVAYPYGEYTPALTRETQELGFALGFSQDPGAIGRSSDLFRLPRFAVVGAVADMATFRERMRYLPLPLEDLSPPPGWLATPVVREIRVRIPSGDRFEPGSENVFVSEWGPLDATFDPRSGEVRAQGKGALSRRINRVLVSLRDRGTGRYALGAWLVLNPGGTP